MYPSFLAVIAVLIHRFSTHPWLSFQVHIPTELPSLEQMSLVRLSTPPASTLWYGGQVDASISKTAELASVRWQLLC
jgi:hypothetical protein